MIFSLFMCLIFWGLNIGIGVLLCSYNIESIIYVVRIDGILFSRKGKKSVYSGWNWIILFLVFEQMQLNINFGHVVSCY